MCVLARPSHRVTHTHAAARCRALTHTRLNSRGLDPIVSLYYAAPSLVPWSDTSPGYLPPSPPLARGPGMGWTGRGSRGVACRGALLSVACVAVVFSRSGPPWSRQHAALPRSEPGVSAVATQGTLRDACVNEVSSRDRPPPAPPPPPPCHCPSHLPEAPRGGIPADAD